MKSFVNVIYLSLSIYSWLIIARAVLSWFPQRSGGVLSRIHEVLYTATEPYLAVFRRLLPMARIGGGAIDLSPVVGLVVLFVAMRMLALL